jgi:hypothetical protein
MKTLYTLTRPMRVRVRKYANAPVSNCPVIVVEGARPPTALGEGCEIRDKHDKVVKGVWGDCYYYSTRRVVVGVEWLRTQRWIC